MMFQTSRLLGPTLILVAILSGIGHKAHAQLAHPDSIELLADELDLYKHPIDYFGMLSEQDARAARLVIDTGLHTKNWSRQKAVDYMKRNTAWSAGDIENDIDRHISNPGQATSYMLGMLEIKRLREQAEAGLGKDFDRRAFHDRVVGFGGITLPMLETSIEQWIQQNQITEPGSPQGDQG